MARPKGSGGRSWYDKYRRFSAKSKGRKLSKTYQHRNRSGQFMKQKGRSKFDKSFSKPRYRGKKSRFDK